MGNPMESRWNGPGQQWMQPPPWAMGMMGSMFEAMKMGMTSSSRPADRGLLGPLMGDGGRRGFQQHGLPDPRNDYGDQHRLLGGPRTSLMEVFNRVSAAGGAVQSMLPGVLESSKALMGGHGLRSAEPQPWMGAAGKDFEVGSFQGGTRGGVRRAGQDHSCQPQDRGDPLASGDQGSNEQGGNPAGSHSGDPSSGGGHHGGGA